MRFLLVFIITSSLFTYSQDFDYYFIGDTSDVSTTPSFGVCMMGGATEDDNGSSWFLNKADGGNIVVIRASGGDGYNDYFYNQLGITMQSVETFVFNSSNASQNSFVQRRLSNAEAIWIAGGDQFIYESFWKNTYIQDILNTHINDKRYPIGGTSAGMAILGEYYFNAANGTVTSATAMSNPFDVNISVETDFLNIPFLSNTITDTHYDNPDRKGRHGVFIARMLVENEAMSFGIAADEYVAICIDETGKARVFGQYPTHEDYAYFIRTNCDLKTPETFEEGNAVKWGNPYDALVVNKMPGTLTGNNEFDLNSWTNINGGTWYGWNMDSGSLFKSPIVHEPCDLSEKEIVSNRALIIYPNPVNKYLNVKSSQAVNSLTLKTIDGKTVCSALNSSILEVTRIPNGIYLILINTKDQNSIKKRVIINH